MWGLVVCYKDKGGGSVRVWKQLAVCDEGEGSCPTVGIRSLLVVVDCSCCCLAPKLTVTNELLPSSSHSLLCILALLWCTSLKIPGVHMYLMCPGSIGGLLCLFESCDPNSTAAAPRGLCIWALYICSGARVHARVCWTV